jgi:adenosylhomocysteinase
MTPKVYAVPCEIDDSVADLKLKSMEISIDKLTPEQQKYLSAWEMGTT